MLESVRRTNDNVGGVPFPPLEFSVTNSRLKSSRGTSPDHGQRFPRSCRGDPFNEGCFLFLSKSARSGADLRIVVSPAGAKSTGSSTASSAIFHPGTRGSLTTLLYGQLKAQCKDVYSSWRSQPSPLGLCERRVGRGGGRHHQRACSYSQWLLRVLKLCFLQGRHPERKAAQEVGTVFGRTFIRSDRSSRIRDLPPKGVQSREHALLEGCPRPATWVAARRRQEGRRHFRVSES